VVPVLLVVVLVTGCGRLGFAVDGDDVVEIDAAALPLDGPTAVIPAICNKRTLGTVPTGANAAVVVRASALASGGFAVAIQTTSVAVHVARILPDGSFVGLHTPLAGGYELYGAGSIGDNVFLYAATGGSAYVKALDATWDNHMTAQGGADAVSDPPLAVMPTGMAWLGMISGGSTTFGEVASNGTSTGLVADYQPVTATSTSFVSAPSGVRAAIDRGDGTCETLLIGPGGVTSLRETIMGCALPHHAPFVGDTGALLYRQGTNVVIRVIDSDPMTSGLVYILGAVDNPRIVTREGRSWIGYTAGGSSTVQLVSIGIDGIVSGAAPDLSPPFDLLEKGAFWVEGTELLTGDTCVK